MVTNDLIISNHTAVKVHLDPVWVMFPDVSSVSYTVALSEILGWKTDGHACLVTGRPPNPYAYNRDCSGRRQVRSRKLCWICCDQMSVRLRAEPPCQMLLTLFYASSTDKDPWDPKRTSNPLLVPPDVHQFTVEFVTQLYYFNNTLLLHFSSDHWSSFLDSIFHYFGC